MDDMQCHLRFVISEYKNHFYGDQKWIFIYLFIYDVVNFF